jgi:hypothetical protein
MKALLAMLWTSFTGLKALEIRILDGYDDSRGGFESIGREANRKNCGEGHSELRY